MRSETESVCRKWLITGAAGMLGSALQRVLAESDERYLALARRDLDVTDSAAVGRAVGDFAASLAEEEAGVLVNAAAFTDVEGAEDDPESAYRANEHGAGFAARAAAAHGLTLVHVSTDFVFDGTKESPYTEDDEPNPLSVYGASKLGGERAVQAVCPEALIVRTAWVFGENGRNFPVKILQAARDTGRVSVVVDEIGSPTYTIDLARGIMRLVDSGVSGLVHVAGAGSCSRYELARETLRVAGVQAELLPVKGAEFPTKAARPANSVLDCSRAERFGVDMPKWEDALARFLGDTRGK